MDQMNEQENSIQTEAQDPSEEPQPLSGVRRGFRWWIISTVLFVTVFLLVGVGYFLDIKQSNKQPSPATTPALQPIKVPTTSSIGNCDQIKLEAAKTQFCLDNRLIKNYDVEYFDWRDKKIKDQMKAGVNIETQDYKESGETIIGSNSWREFKIVSGIKISFSADFNPRIKTFDELKNMYLKTFYEPHDEFPPHKGWKANSLNDLDYVYSLKRNDPESYSKGFEVETHFVKNDKKYELTIWASPKSISEEHFKLLYNTILKTIEFGTESKREEAKENEGCIDSNAQCRGKPDKTPCTVGIWCDEQGRICGGQSCVGAGLGECYKEKCIVP